MAIVFSGLFSNFFVKSNFPVRSNKSIFVAKFSSELLTVNESFAGFGYIEKPLFSKSELAKEVSTILKIVPDDMPAAYNSPR